MRYQDVRDTIKTGDVLLFSGTGPISGLIKFGTGSPWSHVGMAVRLRDIDTVLLYESTTLSLVPDLASGVARQGVQIVPLSDRLATYEGDVALRPLKYGLNMEEERILMDFRREVRGRPYERSNLELARSALDLVSPDQATDLSSIFCSELVAAALQRLKRLPGTPSSNEYTPKDFGVGGSVGRHVNFEEIVSLTVD